MTEPADQSSHIARQFFVAARALACHGGSLQERLADAYADHLLVVTVHDMPAELRESFGELEALLNGDQTTEDDDDPFQAAAARLSDDQARAMIERILFLYGRLVAGLSH